MRLIVRVSQLEMDHFQLNFPLLYYVLSDISELYIVISFIGRDSGVVSRCLFHCDIIETVPLIRWLSMLVFHPSLFSPANRLLTILFVLAV